MDIVNFIGEHYIWFLIGGIVLLMTIIGYIAEKTNFGKNQFMKKEKKPEKDTNKELKEGSPVDNTKFAFDNNDIAFEDNNHDDDIVFEKQDTNDDINFDNEDIHFAKEEDSNANFIENFNSLDYATETTNDDEKEELLNSEIEPQESLNLDNLVESNEDIFNNLDETSSVTEEVFEKEKEEEMVEEKKEKNIFEEDTDDMWKF